MNGDNGINGDNNGVSQAGSGLPIFTPVIALAGLTEPGTKAVPFGANYENTIDIGLNSVFVTVGNMVFHDSNGNGAYDVNEGIGGVVVSC